MTEVQIARRLRDTFRAGCEESVTTPGYAPGVWHGMSEMQRVVRQ